MRPLELELSGFTCFQERQLLSFERLDLFAIAGPTGSGKTTLLDAMVFALYGEIPRVGKQGFKEFISLGQGRMSVRLDFEVGARRLRVTRYSRRTGASGAQLEELDGDQTRPVVDGIRAVDEEIGRLLGLGARAFLQSVVLPQGEFARFLRSSPAERRQLLTELLQLDLYEKMRREATRRAAELKTRIELQEKRLGEDYADANPAQRAELEEQSLRLDEEVTAAAATWRERTAVRERLAQQRELTVQLARQEEILAGLEARREEVRATADRVEAARRASRVVPLLEAVDHARTEAEESRAAAAAAQERETLRRAELDQATARHERTRERAAQLEQLRDRHGRLAQVLPLLGPRRDTAQRIEGAEEHLAAVASALEEAEAERVQAAAARADALREQEAHQGALEELGYDPEGHARLREAAAASASLRHLLDARADLGRAVTAAEATLDTRRQALAAARRGRAESEQARDETTARRTEAESSLEAGRVAASALDLRAHLHLGEPCPVCEQPVAALPAMRSSPELESLRAAAEEAGASAAAAANEHQRRCNEETRLATEVERVEEELERRRSDAREADEEIEQATRSLEAAVGDLLTPTGPLPERVREATEIFDSHAREHAKLERALGEARDLAKDAQRREESARERIASREEEQRRLRETLAQARRSLEELTARIAEAATTDDPEAEQREVAARIENIDTELRASAAAAEEARGRHQEAEHASQTATALDAKAADALTRARDRAREAAAAAGFPSAEDAAEATLEEDARRRLVEEVERWHREHEGAGLRIAELSAQLGDGRVDLASLEEAREAEAEAGRVHQETRDEKTRLEKELEALVARIEKARRLHGEIAADREAEGRYAELATELRSNHFQDYLLQETFRKLVRGASTRLFELSGRYTLALEDNEFRVVDHDHAREQRSASTLSGGETFLASLSLALELSEQIQQAAGAVRLDSLFIDEGFGTLDPETLDTVASTIETLGSSDRMVGLITHVRELTDRMPARIVVSKHATGSSVKVVTA